MNRKSLVYSGGALFLLLLFLVAPAVYADVAFSIVRNESMPDCTIRVDFTESEVTSMTVTTPDGRVLSGTPEGSSVSVYVGDAPAGTYKFTVAGSFLRFNVNFLGGILTPTPTTPVPTGGSTPTPTSAPPTPTSLPTITPVPTKTATPTSAPTTPTKVSPTPTVMASESTAESNPAESSLIPAESTVPETTLMVRPTAYTITPKPTTPEAAAVVSDGSSTTEESTAPSETKANVLMNLPVQIEEVEAFVADAVDQVTRLPILNVISGKKTSVQPLDWILYVGVCFLIGLLIGRLSYLHIRNRRRAENDISVEVRYREKDSF